MNIIVNISASLNYYCIKTVDSIAHATGIYQFGTYRLKRQDLLIDGCRIKKLLGTIILEEFLESIYRRAPGRVSSVLNKFFELTGK